MPPTNNPQVSRLSAWRPKPGEQRRSAGRRLAKRLLLIVLLGGLFWGFRALIANPLTAPGTQLILLSGISSDHAGTLRMPPFVTADFESLLEIAPVLRRTAVEETRVYSPAPLKTRAQLQRIGAACDARIDSPNDVVILYLRATGLLVDGQPQLAWAFDRQWTKDQTLPVKAVLQLLADRACATKLLILDCDSTGWELQNGTFVNNFISEVQKLVHAKNDPSLWVMTSRADFESSYFSRSLGHTIFGKVFSDALAGSADHDADLSISVAELFRYVNQHTADWIGRRTARQLSQTPQLFHAGDDNEKRSPELLSLSRRYVPPENKETESPPAAPPEPPATSEPTDAAKRILKSLLTPALASQGLTFLSFAGPDEQVPPEAAAKQSADTPDNPDTADTPSSPASPAPAAAPEPQPTGADSPDTAGGQSSADSDPADKPTFTSDVENPAWATLLDAWNKRDTLRAGSPSPAEFAPHISRLLEMKILDWQAAVLFGSEAESLSAADHLKKQLTESENLPAVPETAGDLVRQLASQWPTPSVTDASASLAAREFLESIGVRRRSGQEKTILAEFTLLLNGDSRSDLESWLQKRNPQEEFVEFRMARQLISTTDISWPTAVDLLILRMKAETAAASASFAQGRLNDAIERAERLRLEIERQLLYGVAAARPADSAAFIARADKAYTEILETGQLLRHAEQTVREILSEVPSRIADFRIQSACPVAASPPFDVLYRHLRQLRDLMRHIHSSDQLSDRDLDDLKTLLADVTETRRVLITAMQHAIEGVPKNGPIDAVLELRIRQFVDSTLPTAKLRNHLLTALETIVPETRESPLSRSQRIRRSFVPADIWDIIQQHAQLEILRCEMMVDRQTQPELYIEPLVRAYDKAVTESQATADASERAVIWNQEFGAAVASAHRRIVNRLAETYAAAAKLPTPAKINACLSLEPALFLLPTSQMRRLELPDTVSLASLKGQAASERGRQMQVQRTRIAQDDAPAVELKRLNADLDRLNDPSTRQPAIRVNVAAEVPLDVGQTLEFSVPIHNQSAADVPVQLTVEYDETNLAITSAPGFHIFPATEVRVATRTRANDARRTLNSMIRHAALSTISDPDLESSKRQRLRAIVQSGNYPIRASSVSTDATVTIPAGETRTVPLKITGLKFSRQPAKIVLRLETATQYLRYDVTARIPTPRIAEAVLTGVPGTFNDSSNAKALNPFPNALTSYGLILRGLSDVETAVELEILSSTEAAEPLPQYAIGKPEAAALLSQLGAFVVFAGAEPVSLTPGAPRPVSLTAPEASDAQDAPEQKETPPVVDSTPPLYLTNGLILKLTETRTQLVSLLHIPITVQHPRRYLETHADFDQSESRFALQVRVPEYASLPDSDVSLALEFDPPLSNGAVRTVLNRQRRESVLQAVLPADGLEIRRAILSVSDYPSAFAWRIDQNQSATEIPEDDRTLAVRIVTPDAGQAWPTPIATVPLTVQITAPPGFPGGIDDRIEVGIDANRDRVLQNESVVNLNGTHRVDVVWQGVTADGRFTLSSSVGHMTLDIPADNIGSQNANLLAMITDGREIFWSRPVPVTFDGAKPLLRNLAVAPSEFQAVGQPLKIVVRATDGDLSGVAQVKSGFIADDTHAFLETAPTGTLVPSPSGLWTGDLDTAGLVPGMHTVAVQAVDRAGNVSSPVALPVRIVSAEEAAQRAAEVTNLVRGTVLYGGRPLPQATVTLKPGAPEPAAATPEADVPAPSPTAAAEPMSVQTDELGNFRMPDVRVGSYLLTAESLVRGLKRIRTFDVVVAPPPARIRLDVELR